MKKANSYKDLIWQDEERMSGTTCFFGTRIPVSYLFEYLEAGKQIEDFARDYRISVDMARQVVHLANEKISSFFDSAA